MKLWHKILLLWVAVALINLVWGAAIIVQGGTQEDAKDVTYSLRIVIFVLGSITRLALIKGEGEFFKPDERCVTSVF